MNIIELLTDFASCLPCSSLIEEKLKNIPEEIRAAFESNNNELLKTFLSNQNFYANEVRVTAFNCLNNS